MFTSPIIRMNGAINKVNDQVIGNVPRFGTSTTASQVSGQLGQPVWLDDSNLIYDSAIGTVYGGRFRYVRLAAGAIQPARGQIVFWDISVANNLYQVTTSEAGTVPGAQFMAGIVLNPAWTLGYYSFIQDLGPVAVKFRSVLTAAPAGVGTAVYAAAAGAGANNGLADTIGSANPSLMSDINLMQNRYLGAAIELPVNGGTTLVYFNPRNIRG